MTESLGANAGLSISPFKKEQKVASTWAMNIFVILAGISLILASLSLYIKRIKIDDNEPQSQNTTHGYPSIK